MFITQFLCDNCIIDDFSPSSKDEALYILAEKTSSVSGGVEAEYILGILKERELLGSTGIGGGIAIPHGKVKGIDRLIVIFARSKSGVPFDAIDSMPVHIIFLLIAPDAASISYLKILSRISRLLKTEGFYNSLLQAEDVFSIKKLIKEADERLPLSL